MSQSDVVDRIRQVAIVLTSADASTARKLLGQLPETQARLVRQRMAKLGVVSPKEREAAMEAFVRLNRSMKESSSGTAAASNHGSPASPAEAILSKVPESIDRFEVSNNAPDTANGFERSAANTDDNAGFVPVQSQGSNPFSPPWGQGWQQWSGDDIARMLMNERPNVIAALVLQCPTDLGAGIVQALPATIASSVLAALPQLHSTDPFVLQEIYDQLHVKLIDFQRQTSPANTGMTKLQSLMTTMAGEQKHRIQQELARSEPMLAHSLGLTLDQPVESNAMPVTTSNVESNHRGHDAIKIEVKTETEAEEFSDVAEMIVPFVGRNKTDELLDDTANEPTFEELVQFNPEDLAIVLRSLDPQTILLAMSAAGPAMRERVESLIPKKDIDRLRKRLQALRRVSLVEKNFRSAKNCSCRWTIASARSYRGPIERFLRRGLKRMVMATVLKSRQIQHGENTASIEVFNWEDVAAKAKAYLAEVRKQATAILEQAKVDSERLCLEAEQKGRTSGMNDIQQQAERLASKLTTERVGQASRSIHSLADELEQATQQWLRQWQHETVPLAVAIAERLVHRQIEIDPSILLDWLHESVRLIQGDMKLELRMHPEDIQTLGDSLTDFIEQQKHRTAIQLVPDTAIERHGMVLRTSESTIDQQLCKQLERLREELQ